MVKFITFDGNGNKNPRKFSFVFDKEIYSKNLRWDFGPLIKDGVWSFHRLQLTNRQFFLEPDQQDFEGLTSSFIIGKNRYHFKGQNINFGKSNYTEIQPQRFRYSVNTPLQPFKIKEFNIELPKSNYAYTMDMKSFGVPSTQTSFDTKYKFQSVSVEKQLHKVSISLTFGNETFKRIIYIAFSNTDTDIEKINLQILDLNDPSKDNLKIFKLGDANFDLSPIKKDIEDLINGETDKNRLPPKLKFQLMSLKTTIESMEK